MRRTFAVLAVALMSLAFASSALAQSATEDAYQGAAGVQQFGGPGNGDSQLVASTSPESSSSLPFTGLDLGLVAIAGIALVGTGLIVRRTSRTNLRA